MVELCSVRRVQQAHHRGYDPAFLDEFYQPVEDGGGITVKAHDEPCLDLETGLLDLLHARGQIAVLVLHLAAFGQTFLIGRLDADKDRVEPGADHHAHELLIIGKVDGRFRVKGEGMFFPFHPLNDGREYFFFQLSLVSDEVIIDKKYTAFPSPRVEALKLGDNVLGVLGPRYAAVQHRDVAEFAVKGAPARILDVHGRVSFHVHKLPERNRRAPHVRPFMGGVEAACLPPVQIIHERLKRDLGLVEHKMVHIPELLMTRGEQGTSCNDLHAERFASVDHGPGGLPLDRHGAQEDIIRPQEISVLQGFHVHVDKLLVPCGREHGSHGQEAQGRKGRFFGNKLQGIFKAPEGIGVLGIHEKDLHGRLLVCGEKGV